MCPEGEHAIKAKALVSVQLTPMPQEELTSHLGTGREKKYQCPVCRREITNATRVAVLARCGHVLCAKCISMFRAPEKSTRPPVSLPLPFLAPLPTALACLLPCMRVSRLTYRPEGLVKKDKQCVVCSIPCEAADIIPLASGGTGFAGHGEQLEAQVVTPAARV